MPYVAKPSGREVNRVLGLRSVHSPSDSGGQEATRQTKTPIVALCKDELVAHKRH